MKILFALSFLLPFAAFAGDAPEPIPPILDATAVQDGQEGRAKVDPCDDFYRFACGGWLARTVIPADKSYVSRQTTVASDSTDLRLNKILTAYAKGDFSLRASAAAKLRDHYESCLGIDRESPAAIAEAKARMSGLRGEKKPAEFARMVAELHLSGAGAFFGFASAQDLDDSAQVIGDLFQGGIALGQRDFYFPEDEKGRAILKRYRAHVAKVFRLLGWPTGQAGAAAATVLRLETALARASYTLADQNDPSKTRHPMSLEQIAQLAPHFDWPAYFAEMGNAHLARQNVDEPEFLQAFDKLLATTPRAEIETYLAWQYAHGVAPLLGGELEKENFAFWLAYLNGAKKPKPRWKLCTQAVENQLGYAIAEAYVQTFDGKAIKSKTEEMIRNVKDAFTADLAALSTGPGRWMDPATAELAREKVAMMQQKVGGPEKWRDYSALDTVKGSYLRNTLAAVRFETKRDIAKIGKPVDRTEWSMMPWEINAYYDRSKNEFNFPFGILQPPSLDLSASDGANLGAFGGGTIGHELTHGFDNNGSQYDAKGNVKNWWTQATLQQFQAKSACFVEQADRYKIASVKLAVNGKNTLEENLADQGGVKLGYAALEKILGTRAEAAPWNGRYTERQQYWLAYAQSWCTQITAENLRHDMTTDVHPPAEFRVNAVMMNRPEFARDFACRPGSRMAPRNRCAIW